MVMQKKKNAKCKMMLKRGRMLMWAREVRECYEEKIQFKEKWNV